MSPKVHLTFFTCKRIVMFTFMPSLPKIHTHTHTQNKTFTHSFFLDTHKHTHMPCQRSALQKRVGMLKMGSFLHTSYEALNKFKPRPPPDISYAELPRNHSKNRKGAPLPPGHSRVKLQLVLEEVGSDYINAR